MDARIRAPGTKRRTNRATRRRRVLIVNGVSIWREAITRHINRCRDLKVCGEADEHFAEMGQGPAENGSAGG